MSGPERTCVGCRTRRPIGELIRLTIGPDPAPDSTDGGVILVIAGQGGRGAWLCPSVSCFDRGVRRRSIGRALRAEVSQTSLAEARIAFVQRCTNVGG